MPKTILVADDEEDTCNFIKKILERKGHKVYIALDGIQAHKIIEDKIFDVALLDCSMPGLTGFELIKLIKETNPNTKIIIFSGYSAMDERLADDLGVEQFLQKPLTIEMIQEAIGD